MGTQRRRRGWAEGREGSKSAVIPSEGDGEGGVGIAVEETRTRSVFGGGSAGGREGRGTVSCAHRCGATCVCGGGIGNQDFV